VSSETYRKHGRTVRLERIGSDRALVAVTESGEAETREDGLFSCRSLPAHVPMPEVDAAAVIAVERAIDALLVEPLSLERLIITSGIASHERESAAGRLVWNDVSFRIHASIVNRPSGLRVLWDDAFPDAASLRELARAAASLADAEHGFGDAPARIQLAGSVAAALWPILLEALASGNRAGGRSELTLRQSAEGVYEVDGNGEAIAGSTLFDGVTVAGSLPNAFRPTYRRRPRPTPMNLQASLARSDAAPADALAVAILEPPATDGSVVAAGVLVVHRGRPVPMRLRMTPDQWCEAVVALAGDGRWYPQGAGSFGCDTTLDITRAGGPGRGVFSWSEN
jgi:hypothetical protein